MSEQSNNQDRAAQWGRLYTAANAVCSHVGFHGSIAIGADKISSLMDALHDLDGGSWMPGLTPAHAAPMAKPLTDEQVQEERKKGWDGPDGFEAGVRFAEYTHGISEGCK